MNVTKEDFQKMAQDMEEADCALMISANHKSGNTGVFVKGKVYEVMALFATLASEAAEKMGVSVDELLDDVKTANRMKEEVLHELAGEMNERLKRLVLDDDEWKLPDIEEEDNKSS